MRGFRSFFSDFFERHKTMYLNTSNFETEKFRLNFIELAISIVADVVGKTLARTDFLFRYGGDITNSDEWYHWNVRPNKNETATQFKKKLARRLIIDGECLIIKNIQGDYLIADEFTKTEYANVDNEFSNVIVGDYSFPFSFRSRDVIYLQISNSKFNDLQNMVFGAYESIITHAAKTYKSSFLKKIKIVIEKTFSGDENNQKAIEEKLKTTLNPIMGLSDSAITETKGIRFEPFDEMSMKSTIPIADIINIRKDAFEMVANVFGIPVTFLTGDTTDLDTAKNELISEVMNPIYSDIKNSLEYALFEKSEIIAGDGIIVDTSKVRTVDIFKQASNIDKLISSGYMSIDEVRARTDLSYIDEQWAKVHYLTKNYARIENIMNEENKSLENLEEKGGEE